MGELLRLVLVIQVVGSVVLTISNGVGGVGGVGGVEAEEVRDGVKVGPEFLWGQLPAALYGDQVGNDSASTHLSVPLSDW